MPQSRAELGRSPTVQQQEPEPSPQMDAPVGTPQWAAQSQGTLGNAEIAQRLQASGDGGGAGNPEDIFGAATQGGASGVPFLKELEAAFGQDFSSVRVYTGRQDEMAALGAQAAACGEQIVFAGASPDLELVAHELAHVVQQRQGGGGAALAAKAKVSRPGDAAEREADRVGQQVKAGEQVQIQSKPGADIHLAIDTYGGSWDTPTYLDNSTRASSGFITWPSAKIELVFSANDLVNSPKIGITQTTNAQTDGTPAPVRPEVVGRSTTSAAHGEEGRYLDRAAARENPMYGVNNQAWGTSNPQLGGGTNASTSRFGHRTLNPDGTVQSQADAYLYDAPARGRAVTDPSTGAGQHVRHEFEATALCLEGDMAGTYLGSVQWGYDVDQHNNFSLIPFAVVSMGTPSSPFMAAANLWNQATVDDGSGGSLNTIDLPITGHQSVDPTGLTDDKLFQRIRLLTIEIASLDPSSPDYQNKRFEARGLAREAHARGASAADSGLTHTVRSGDTLVDLARAHLRGASKWTHILALNVAEIQDSNLIFPGQVLKMPKPFGKR